MKIGYDRLNEIVCTARKASSDQLKVLTQAERKLLVLSCDAFKKKEALEVKNENDFKKFNHDLLNIKNIKKEDIKHSNFLIAFFKFIGNLLHLRISSEELYLKILSAYDNKKDFYMFKDSLKKSILNQISLTGIAKEDIQSAKGFLKIDCKGKSFLNEFNVSKEDSLPQKIEECLNKVNLSADDEQIDSKWYLLFKDTRGEIFDVSPGGSSQLSNNVKEREESIKIMLDYIGIKQKPILNEQQEFINTSNVDSSCILKKNAG